VIIFHMNFFLILKEFHIKNIKDNFRRIPNKGIGYGILRYLTPPELKENTQFNLQPEISFNYLGQFNMDKQAGPFEMSHYSPGQSMSPNRIKLHALDVSGIISMGQLHLSVGYNAHEFKEERIRDLMELYREKLEEIIEHCATHEGEELTPGDLSYAELESDELDELKSLVSDID